MSSYGHRHSRCWRFHSWECNDQFVRAASFIFEPSSAIRSYGVRRGFRCGRKGHKEQGSDSNEKSVRMLSRGSAEEYPYTTAVPEDWPPPAEKLNELLLNQSGDALTV